MTEEKKRINYMVVCVNEFANKFQISPKEAFSYLYDHKGIEFIKENYDIEHTLSFDDAIEDLTLICRKNGTCSDAHTSRKNVVCSMSSEQQMVEYMVQDLVEMLTESRGIEYDQAMHILFDSSVYDKVADERTGLYRESPAYVYGLLQDELTFGHIVQAEI
jgi:hypothetical protein